MHARYLGFAPLLFCGLGCHELFSIDHVDLPRDAQGMTDESSADAHQCTYEMLAPDRDADSDGVLNGADTCPLVANHDPHDEDADTVPDACDLCPQAIAAGADLDCDGLGAACDPDDMIPHERQFYGFGSSIGMQPSGDALIQNDQLRFPTVIGYGYAYSTMTFGANGTYETTLAIRDIDNTFQRASITLRYGTPTNLYYRMALEFDGGSATLKVYDDPAGTIFGQISLGAYAAATADVRLVATLAPGTVTLTVSGSVTGTLVTTMVVPPVPDVEIGILAYSSTATSFGVDASYFSRIAVP